MTSVSTIVSTPSTSIWQINICHDGLHQQKDESGEERKVIKQPKMAEGTFERVDTLYLAGTSRRRERELIYIGELVPWWRTHAEPYICHNMGCQLLTYLNIMVRYKYEMYTPSLDSYLASIFLCVFFLPMFPLTCRFFMLVLGYVIVSGAPSG